MNALLAVIGITNMLDYVAVFSKGGIELWSCNATGDNITPFLNNFIKNVVLEERNTESNYFEDDNLAIQFRLDNEYDLMYACVFQKILQLPYLEVLLSGMQNAFKQKYGDNLANSQLYTISYDFNREFEATLSAAEKLAHQNSKAPKQMRSYRESLKSKKNVASLIENTNNKKIDPPKKVNIIEIPKPIQEDVISTESIILENRRKMKERLSKKNASENKNKVEKERAGKKPRVWDLGGSPKENITLDRSKGQSSDVKYQPLQKHIVGTMQGEVSDLIVENDGDNMNDETSFINLENIGKTKKNFGILSYFKGIVGGNTLQRESLHPALEKMCDHLITKNVAADIAYKLCDSVAANLEGKHIGTFETIAHMVKEALSTSLIKILSPKRRVDIIRDALEAKNNHRPYSIIFCGVNGVGKSTNLSKICFWLIENDFNVLIAACDTFRAGAVEQLRTHTRHLNALHPAEKHKGRLMVQLYEKGYGKDAAGVAMEAIKYASETCIDIVLIDTAGRMQDNEPLMRSLAKLIKINNPDLVLFVGEALVGNEAVDQLVKFNQSLADYSDKENPHVIDGIVLTKFDTIDDKVGAAISMTYITGQPIVFVGTGQTYADLKALNVNTVVQSLMK